MGGGRVLKDTSVLICQVVSLNFCIVEIYEGRSSVSS